jgi:AcrR family transcriptional regulator
VPLVIIQRVYYWRVPRPPLYSTDEILDAARELVLTGGARAATLDAIVAASGAPKGSIYHRFPTLNALLAAMWVRSVRRSQACFIAELELEDAYEAAVAAGLAIHDFALAHPGDARLLASLRRVDLVESVTDPQLSASLEGLNDPLVESLRALARRLYGRGSRQAVERTRLAVIDLPQGAVRRHLVSGTPIPRSTRPQLAAAIRGALDAPMQH